MKYSVSVYSTPQKVKGYYASRTNKVAHVILRKQANRLSADIGFEKKKDKYLIHMDSMDKRKLNRQKLKQLYAKHKLTSEVKKRAGKYSLKSTRVDKDGRIRLKVGLRGG